MNVKNQVDGRIAALQWQRLVEILHLLGAEVVELPAVNGLPDLVFTANAALISKNTAVVSHFKYPERQGETPVFQDWFQKHGFDTVVAPFHFEGAGDALSLGNVLYMGTGFRSNERMWDWFVMGSTRHFADQIQLVKLQDPYFYHLDTCFCPLNDHQALAYPPALDVAWPGDVELITVPENEARQFACNAVVVDKTVVMPEGCPETKNKLELLGFAVVATPMTEFIKAGGACKCLTLRL